MEFLILFVPFLITGIGLIYVGLNYPIHFLINPILIILGVIALAIDAFALLVQYVNWRYYKE